MPAELEALPPLMSLPLVSTSSIHTRSLRVESASSEYLRLIETVVSSTELGPHTYHIPHTFRFGRDAVIPLYAVVKQKCQEEWIMQVIFDGFPTVFSFAHGHEVLELQRHFTGYQVTDCFEHVETLASLKGSRRNVFRQHPKQSGIAAVQIWEWPDESLTQGLSQLSPTSTNSSQTRTPASSLTPSQISRFGASDSATTIQVDHDTGKRAVVTQRNPPPVLVLFLQEPGQYTMLRVDITNIETMPALIQGGWLGIRHSTVQQQNVEENMVVHKVSVNHSEDGAGNLSSWNLCLLRAGRLSPEVETRKCKSILLKFDTAAETERFDQAFLECRLRRSQALNNINAARDLANRTRPSRTSANSPTSPSSSLGHFTPLRDSQLYTTMPRSPGPSMSHDPSAPSRDYQTYANFQSMAVSSTQSEAIAAEWGLVTPGNSSSPQINTVIPGYRLELETERPPREVHGVSMGPQELYGSSGP